MSASTSSFRQDVTLYCLVKVVTSLDDLVWLSPFVAILRANNTQMAQAFGVYTAISLVISCLAMLLAWLTRHGFLLLLSSTTTTNGSDTASSSLLAKENVGAILNIVAALCIACLAFLEWRNSNNEEEEQRQQEPDVEATNSNLPATEHSHLLSQSTTATQVESSSPPPEQEQQKRKRHVLCDLLLVGIFGQLDTLAVFCSVLLGQGTVRANAVWLGSLVAVVVILAIATGITAVQPLTHCLRRIPMHVLLAIIALYILLQGVWNI